MPVTNARTPNFAIAVIRDSLRAIGYRDSLVHQDYAFGDPASPSIVRAISLAAFGAEPPSYRTACLGIGVLEYPTADTVAQFRGLGAPQVFIVAKNNGEVSRWGIRAAGKAEHLENIPIDEVLPRFLQARDLWAPAAVLRLKSAEFAPPVQQLDFFDVGLLPALEGEVHEKLHVLLQDIVATARDTWLPKRTPTEAQAGALYRLVFRLLAAKLLIDRQNANALQDNDTLDDPAAVLDGVNRWYNAGPPQRQSLPPRAIQSLVWRRIRDGLHLQNLSVEALAFVYENTMVSPQQRRMHGTHATPWRVAEYMVNALPLEALPMESRTICEPFSGHAPFLVAAMSRLKALSLDLDVAARHAYLARMLQGIEVDPFAAEVARYSLMLADYPAANGWKIYEGDVFDSVAQSKLHASSIILSNPPFEDFGDSPNRASAVHANKAVAALRTIVDANPRMFGVVLPQAFIDGHSYAHVRRLIADRYGHTQVIWLPDVAFAHAQIETAILLASRDAPVRWQGHVSAKMTPSAYAQFECGITPPMSPVKPLADGTAALWSPPLADVWDALRDHPLLSDELEDSSRGIEYVFSVRDYPERVWSRAPKRYYMPGIMAASGDGFTPFLIDPVAVVNLNMQEGVQRSGAYRKPWSRPKVLVNATRKSRGMWAVVAVPDHAGLVCYQSMTALWPRRLPIEVVAAIINGPVANAYVATHNAKRHVRLETLRAIPFPRLGAADVREIVRLVHRYIRVASRRNSKRAFSQQQSGELANILRTIDALVLQGYALPARLERAVLLRFQGEPRPGPVSWLGYYDEPNPPAISWTLYSSPAYQNASADRLRTVIQPLNDPEIGAALALADNSASDNSAPDNSASERE